MKMKKFILRDEYVAPSRAELKAFIDAEFNGVESDGRKVNVNIENAKGGRYEARDYEYLDGSIIHLEAIEAVKRDEIEGRLFNSGIQAGKCIKYEGRIYEREEELSLYNNDKDVEIVVPKFVRDHVLVANYVGICHQNLMAMAKAGIMPVMAGAKLWELWEVNDNNDDFIGQSSRNYNHEMIDEIVERGIKWSKLMYDGVDASRAFAKSWVNDERNSIKVIGVGELEVKSMFYSLYVNGKYQGKNVKGVNIVSRNNGLNGEMINMEFGAGKNHRIYKKLYIYDERENEKRKVKDEGLNEIEKFDKDEGEFVKDIISEVKERKLYRIDRDEDIKEDIGNIMKKSSDKLEIANVEHSMDVINAIKNKYINDEGEVKILRGHEIFSINHSHDNNRSGKEEARIRMKERNNNLNKNNGGKYWSAILNKWVSY